MIYDLTVLTPANTPATAPLLTPLKVTNGIVTKLDVVFPQGCHGLLHVAILHALHQIWPLNPEGSFASDGEAISFEEYLSMDVDPYELTVKTWNLDDTYDHHCIVRVGILRPGETMPVSLVYDESWLNA